MKKVLFISPNFFNYHVNLTYEMEQKGYQVFWFNDRPSDNIISKAIIRLGSKKQSTFVKKKVDKYVDDIIENTRGIHFDYVLMIVGQSFSCQNIRKIRDYHRGAKYIYYAWDSVDEFPFIASLAKMFDTAYSFDSEDCKRYGFNFLPLFYCNEYIENPVKYNYASILTIKPGKLDNYKRIKKAMPVEFNKMNSFELLYLQSPFVLMYYKMKSKEFRKSKASDFTYKKLTKEENYKILSQSRVVVDCQMLNQVGLTMRTFEALHLKKKLITTNTNIKSYEFYSPNNIFVVDENTAEIPREFFESEFDDNFELSSKYSAASFIDQLLK